MLPLPPSGCRVPDSAGELINTFTGLALTRNVSTGGSGDFLVNLQTPLVASDNQTFKFIKAPTPYASSYYIQLTSTATNKDTTKVLCLQVPASATRASLNSTLGTVASVTTLTLSTCVFPNQNTTQNKNQAYPKTSQLWTHVQPASLPPKKYLRG